MKIHMSSENDEANGYKHGLDLLISLGLFTCFILYEKWTQREKSPNNILFTFPYLISLHWGGVGVIIFILHGSQQIQRFFCKEITGDCSKAGNHWVGSQ